MKILFTLALLAINLFFPAMAWAEANLKSPLAYSLREYAVILGIALLGGAAGWVRRVKKGEADASFPALVGELMISAFSGLIAFWLCESFEMSPLITAAAAGMAGHAGGTGIAWAERLGKRYAEKRFGLTGPAPLDDRR
ncbi:MAG: phage holin family protein [Hydrogenophaga sp.]|uniref:phage holin family protein n=1 Tax=Hydrogenophaga sp. TaxID=1904254 RepID=UPI001D41B046|nr:phage holin family protein [Hydrogenophaga sp.]MBX3610407.1 phage holin family protein [Hydrogenophaga sp.]